VPLGGVRAQERAPDVLVDAGRSESMGVGAHRNCLNAFGAGG
jgi:hypothetical protein